jgi:hypothetical protein
MENEQNGKIEQTPIEPTQSLNGEKIVQERLYSAKEYSELENKFSEMQKQLQSFHEEQEQKKTEQLKANEEFKLLYEETHSKLEQILPQYEQYEKFYQTEKEKVLEQLGDDGKEFADLGLEKLKKILELKGTDKKVPTNQGILKPDIKEDLKSPTDRKSRFGLINKIGGLTPMN